MTNIDKIKKRIEKRKKIDIINEAIELDNNKNRLFQIVMSIMSIYVLFMSFAIYAKKDQQATMFNSVFNTNINFTEFNQTLNKFLNLRIIEDNTNLLDSEVVSSEINYLPLGDDYYSSDDNIVVAMLDGVVTYVNGKDDNYTIIVEYDNGIRATYSQVGEVNVFVNDRIYQDDIIGSFMEKVQIIFIKNNTKLSYEEVMSII